MEMVDLKRSKVTKKKEEEGPWTQDDYAYGLQIHLTSEELEKLGNPKLIAGNTINITAMARVKSINVNMIAGKKRVRAELQIEKMKIMKDEKKTSGEEVLYGDK